MLFKNVVITTMIAALHVLILVVSTDLGAALIIFVVYLVMLYVATRQPLYMLAGLGAGAGASVIGYYLFGHVRTRVNVWRDPFATYDNGGLSGGAVAVCHRDRKLVWNGPLPGIAGKYPCQRFRFLFFCGDCRRAGTYICPVSDPYICQLLYNVS